MRRKTDSAKDEYKNQLKNPKLFLFIPSLSVISGKNSATVLFVVLNL